MYEEKGCEEILGPSPHRGEAVREAPIEQPSQSKVEVTVEGESNLSVHLTQRPLHDVSCNLHHVTQVLREMAEHARRRCVRERGERKMSFGGRKGKRRVWRRVRRSERGRGDGR